MFSLITFLNVSIWNCSCWPFGIPFPPGIASICRSMVKEPTKFIEVDRLYPTLVFLAIPLSFGYHDHKGYGNNRNQDTCYDIGCQRFSEDQCADQNRCDRFKDSQDGSFGSSDI